MLNTFLFTQKRDVERQIWLITYGSGCQSITHEMLLACGIEVDECYTATWRESKYTLIHSHKTFRLRRTALDKIMNQLLAKFQIVKTEIFGFDSVSCNSQADGKLEDHPGFHIIVEKVNKEPVDLEWWMHCEPKDLYTNRKGLLWKHLARTDPSEMTHAQLVERVRKWAPVVREAAELKVTNTVLSDHNMTLVHRNRELAEALQEERRFSHELLMKRIPDDHERVVRSRLSD